MRLSRPLGFVALILGLMLAVPLHGEERSVSHAPPASPSRGIEEQTVIHRPEGYLQPNVEDHDGVGAYVHVTRQDMPLLVAIGTPPTGARDASPARTREAAIESIKLWQEAIRKEVPWFELEFTERNRRAPVQVEWRRSIKGPWGGLGRVRYWRDSGRLRVGGVMQVSTTPEGPKGRDNTLTLHQVQRLVAHEFGHVLGLGHCLHCRSAMNYSWETEQELLVTEIDALTFAALVAKKNGIRTDGRMLIAYRRSTAASTD